MEILAVLLLFCCLIVFLKLSLFLIKLIFGIVLLPFKVGGAILGAMIIFILAFFILGVKLMALTIFLLPVIIPLIIVMGIIALLVK